MRIPKVYFGLTLRYLFHGIFMWNEFKEFTQTKDGKILNNDLIGIFYSNSDLNYHINMILGWLNSLQHYLHSYV